MQKLGQRLSALAEKYLPDPFLLALLLTFLAAFLAFLMTDSSPRVILVSWRGGLWDLLGFGMQMSLILVFGHALADAPVSRLGIRWLANRPANGRQAVGLVALCAVLTGLFNWGLSLIFSALLAREVHQRFLARGIRISYPLLGTAAYLGLSVWHGGLSGSAPLTVATPGHSLESLMGVVPVSQTLFGTLNLVVSAFLILGLPLYLVFLMPSDQRTEEIISPEEEGESLQGSESVNLAQKLENSRILSLLVGGMGLLSWFLYWFSEGRGLDLNSVIGGLMFLGIFLHPGLGSYMRAFQGGVAGCGGILLQFPLYGGIMGIFKGSGLLLILGQSLASMASVNSLPVVVFYFSALVNLFVPSGGGQWAIQGPLVVQAALDLKLEPSRIVMAMAYGDQWTNLCQPFWALALLGVTGLKARDIMGWCLMVLLPGLILFPALLLLIPN